MFRLLASASVGLALLVATATTARADTIDAFTSMESGTGSQLLKDFSVGLDFEVLAERITIQQLGVWDDRGDGLLSGHEIAVFDTDTQALLAIVYVTPGTSGDLRGNEFTDSGYRYFDLDAPLELAQGQRFTIAVSYYYDNRDTNGNSHGVLMLDETPLFDGGFNAVANIGLSRYGAGNGFPTTPDTYYGGGPANRYHAGSFAYQPNPEPGTLALLGGVLAIGGIVVRRRRRTA